MKIIADTNVLLRAVLPDDEGQQGPALQALLSADMVAVGVHTLCEFVWVMSQRYRASRDEIGTSIRSLLNTANVVVDRPAVAAGLALLDAGGNFADGVIAHEGRWLRRRHPRVLRPQGRAADRGVGRRGPSAEVRAGHDRNRPDRKWPLCSRKLEPLTAVAKRAAAAP